MKLRKGIGLFLILLLVINFFGNSIIFADNLSSDLITNLSLNDTEENPNLMVALQGNNIIAKCIKDNTKILTELYRQKNNFKYVNDNITYTTIAFDFHIFSKEAILNAHTNGNIATKELLANYQSFGTNQSTNLNINEENYLKHKVEKINNINSDGNIIIGSNIATKLEDNNNKLNIGTDSSALEPTKSSKVYQEINNTTNYINIDQELDNLKIISKLLSNHKTSEGVTLSEVNGENQSITVNENTGSSNNCYLNILAGKISSGNNKRILDISIPNGKTLIINIDMANVDINSLQNLVTRINNYSNSEEVVRFDNNVLWNLYDSSSANRLFTTSSEYAKVGNSDYFMGTILAPSANIQYGAVNGSIIANKTMQNNQESHKWDFTGHATQEDPEEPENPNIKEVSISIEGTKTLEGKQLEKDMFSFQLLDKDNNVLQTVKNDANGIIKFDDITYTEPGTYEYKVIEVKENTDDIIYDDNVFNLVVNVVDDGNLVANIEYTNGEIKFANRYENNEISICLDPQKNLVGKDLEKDMFKFQLLNENNEIIEEVTNDEDGNIKFSEIIFDKVGTYNYKIVEVKGDLPGITYDSEAIEVVVEIGRGENGQLEAKVNYPNKEPKFNNIYKVAPTSLSIKGTKTLGGKKLEKDMFKFQLLNENNEVIEEVTNDEDGNIKFNEITYTEPGSYKYKVKEVKENIDEIIYDDKEFNLTVDVVDDGNGNLVAKLFYKGGEIVFTNKVTEENKENQDNKENQQNINNTKEPIVNSGDEIKSESENRIQVANTGDKGLATSIIFEFLVVGALIIIGKKK